MWTSRWFEHNWYFLFGAANFSNLQLYRDIDSHAENSIPFLELTHNLNGQTLVLKPGASKRKIYDVFLFHNELDMLELRLIEQEHVVDCFVIIEQPHTLAGTPKPLYFKEQNTSVVRALHEQIHHLNKRRQATSRRMGKGAAYQKHGPQCSEALKDVDPCAMIIYSDVD